ncbi:flagellar basal body P-ring formation chaperone FlgA [Acidiphilium sp.]|uniref:flagellar basal body P-ring formation chaperone FlgA n=1 Tax=Acidiphilium sp. TaxID=527 RepID=UPI003D001E1B
MYPSIRSAALTIVALFILSPAPGYAQSPQGTGMGAPTARTLVSIDRPVVKLKDIFDHAGPDADATLGPAPSPGTRFTVGARQLAAIATQYGVAWQPDGGDQAVIIERTGVPIAKATIKPVLQRALRKAGGPSHIVLNFSDAQLPMIPPNANPEIIVNRIALDRSTGNFGATILITAPTMNPVSATIAGIATPAVEAVVATHNLFPGEILTPQDLELSWVARNALPHQAIVNPLEAVGMQVVRAVSRGAALNNRVITSPMLIARGATVSLAVDMPGLEVTARGIALAAGGDGGVIPVMNPTSHEIVQAVIDGPDHAHVVPGSMPTRSRGMTPYYNMIGNQP